MRVNSKILERITIDFVAYSYIYPKASRFILCFYNFSISDVSQFIRVKNV